MFLLALSFHSPFLFSLIYHFPHPPPTPEKNFVGFLQPRNNGHVYKYSERTIFRFCFPVLSVCYGKKFPQRNDSLHVSEPGFPRDHGKKRDTSQLRYMKHAWCIFLNFFQFYWGILDKYKLYRFKVYYMIFWCSCTLWNDYTTIKLVNISIISHILIFCVDGDNTEDLGKIQVYNTVYCITYTCHALCLVSRTYSSHKINVPHLAAPATIILFSSFLL